MVIRPPLLHLPNEDAYRLHYLQHYCRAEIETHDNIRVFFRQDNFYHAFFESTLRDGVKDRISSIRCQRMDWIAATLKNPASTRFQGFNKKRNCYDPGRRVDLVYEDFVVVLGLGLQRDGSLYAKFVTCYQAENSISKIRTSPIWTREECLYALTR